VHYTDIFSHSDIDMLRPFGGGVYPGISTDPDPSVGVISETVSDSHAPVEDDGDEDFEDENDIEVNVNMDDILDEPPASPELEGQAGDDWIEHDGHKFHKSSLLRIIFGLYFVPKSKERLERVRAYTMEPSKVEADEPLVGVSLFVLGDLFTALVRTGQTVALAVFQSTSITHKGRKVTSVSAAELVLEGSDINISGQVLHLVTPSTASTTFLELSPYNSPPSHSHTLFWTGDFNAL